MINIDSLGTYVDQERLPLIRKAVLGGKSAKEFMLVTGVKGATTLNLLTTNVEFVDGSNCGWTEAGQQVLSQRTIEPALISVNMSLCDKKLAKTFLNKEVQIAAQGKDVDDFAIAGEFIEGIVEGVGAKLEKAIWQGDKDSGDANLNKFDGIIKIANNASLANTITYADGQAVATTLAQMYKAIPAECFEKGEVRVYMSSEDYRAYLQELVANGNLVITTGINDVAMPESVLIPATNVRVVYVDGLNGTGQMFASYKDNFVYGTDLQGDEEKFDFWYERGQREYRVAIDWTSGVQIAFPELVVRAQKG